MSPLQTGQGQSPCRWEVQGPSHEVLRAFTEYPPFEVVPFARRAAALGVRNMDFIVEYTDSMLNWRQLRTWLEDPPTAIEEQSWTDVERGTAERVLFAAGSA